MAFTLEKSKLPRETAAILRNMTKQGDTAKGHHYVPRAYLERFTGLDGFLAVWDRERDQCRRQRPKEVMKIRFYNRQPWASHGIDPDILETGLGNDMESKAKWAIDRLICDPTALDDNDTATLLTYLEFQRIRVPRQAETAKSIMRETILRLVPASITKPIQDGTMLLTMKESARFDYMRWMTGQLHPWFARMEWEVIAAAEGSTFVTTDSPVSFYNSKCPPPAEAGVALAGTKIFFPLNSHHLLIMRHPECRTEHPLSVLDDPVPRDGVIPITHGTVWDRDVVASTNWKLSQLAHHLVVAENEEALEQCGYRANAA